MSDSDAAYVGHPGATGSFGGPTPGVTRSSSSSTFTGIGNPNFKDPREEKSWYQRVSEAASKTIQADKKGGLIDDDFSKTYSSNRGSNAYGINEPTYIPASSTVYSRPLPTTIPTTTGGIVPDFPTNSNGIGRVGSAASDGSYERSLISSLCEPSGLKAVPPKDLLKQFLVTVHTLSPEIVGLCIIDVLNSDAWQSRVKGLLIIASIAKANEAHRVWWVENGSQELALLASSDMKVAVRNQASKTLSALGLPSTTQPVENKKSGNKAVSMPSLIDDIEDNNTTHSGPGSGPGPGLGPDVTSTSNIFAGLAVSPKVVPSEPQAAVSAFDFLDSRIPANSTIEPSIPNTPPPPAPANPANPALGPSPTTISSAFDFLSDNSPDIIVPSAPTNSPSTDIFHNLNVTSTSHPVVNVSSSHSDLLAPAPVGYGYNYPRPPQPVSILP